MEVPLQVNSLFWSQLVSVEMCLCWKSWTLTLFLDIDFGYNGILVWKCFRLKKGNTWVVFLTATCSFGFATFFIHCLRREWGLMEDTCHLVGPGLFFSVPTERAVIFLKFRGLFQLFSKQKQTCVPLIVFWSLTGFHCLVQLHPA